MAEVLRCKDRWGRTVVLDDECWFDHVVRRRPYFRGHEKDCVEDTLTDPSFVQYDVDYPTRECFYRPSPLPRPYGGDVKVVVEYRPSEQGEEEGIVVTVHLTSHPKAGEKRKWP